MEYSNNKKMLTSEPTKICALPDSLLCRILSTMDMIEVVRTSLVSRRWRYLWASVPVLKFDLEKWEEVHMDNSVEFLDRGFVNFIDKVLLLRDNSEVSKLQISSDFCDPDRVAAWLTVAARRQFQEIHLAICPYEPIELPCLLFTSAITVFKLEVIGDVSCDHPPIKVPNSVSTSPQLKTLWLDWVHFRNGNLDGEFTLSCPVLENLSLIDCDQRLLNSLTLAAPKLKNLVIENNSPDWVGSCCINIWTPNLVSLTCNGFCYRKYSLTNYSSLVDAAITGLHEQPGGHDFVELLRASTCATRIKLGFVESVHKLNDLTNQFSNLVRLKLEMGYGKKLHASVVLQLLMNAPSVKALILDAHELEDYEEEVVSFKCSQLRYAEIGKLKGCELKFLKFLLKNAVVLGKLKIRMCSGSSVLVRENLGKKILSLPKTSATVIVVIVEPINSFP